jgi:signal transduction histidine kinase
MDGRLLAPSQMATLRAVREGKNVYHHEESIRHADGTLLPALVNAVSLNSQHLPSMRKSTAEGDTRRAAIVVHQDMTALKETERLKDEFIALAAHELRTPLAILQGFAQTLLIQTARGKGPALAEWQTEALQEIDHATARMVDLTTDLLDVTRLQSGRLELHMEPTDIVELSMRMVARLQLTTQLHRFSYSSECPHLVVSIDPARIEQILGNVLSNAVKYSPEGGVIQVAVWQDQATHMAIVSIQDQGIGIPVDQQAHIFNRFERAENAQAHGISGTGLGLYLCRELIERHNGRIWLESVEGKGATFFFSLPLYMNIHGETAENPSKREC